MTAIMPSADLVAGASPSTGATASENTDAAITSPSTEIPTSQESLPSFGKYRAVPMREGDENLPRVNPLHLNNGRHNAARAHHITLAKIRDPRSQYWRELVKERKSHRNRIFETPEELWSAFEDYCEFISENPMIVEKNVGKSDEIVRLQAPPIVSKSDFASFCGFTAAMLHKWRDPANDQHREDLSDTIDLIFESMNGAQIRQAAGREADPAFMKVLLNMADRKETRKVVEETPGSDALSKVFEQLKATSGGAEPVAVGARVQVAFDDGTSAAATAVMPTDAAGPVMPTEAAKPTESASAGGEG